MNGWQYAVLVLLNLTALSATGNVIRRLRPTNPLPTDPAASYCPMCNREVPK